MLTIDELVENYDWQEAFACAMRDELRPVPGYSGSMAPFAVGDVAEILALSEGQNDEQSWFGAFRLKDGRFVFVSAWCDHTGWGCQDGGLARVAASLEDLKRLGIDDAVRARLFPGEPTSGASAEPAATMTDADVAREFFRRFGPVKVLVGRFKTERGSLAYAEADGDDGASEWLSGVSDDPYTEEHSAGEDGFTAALERARQLVRGGR